MEIIDVVQGTDQWHSVRRDHLTASEAPVMMGVSPFMTRDELMAMKKLGIEEEKSEYVKRFILNKGHDAEHAIRPHVEALLGEELFPVTGRLLVEDLPLLASFDGITMSEDNAFEHKLRTEAKAEEVSSGRVPEEHVWQLEHQMLVSGLSRILFCVSDGSPESLVHAQYVSDPDRRKRLIAGWKQFQADLAAYQYVEPVLKPAAEPIKDLPALHIQLVGEVKSSNLTIYRSTAMDFISRIKTDLQTDEDFANAEAMVKFCDKAEKELDAAKKMALAQTASIDDLFKTVDYVREELRSKRLMLDKLVKTRKESIRADIINEALTKLGTHVAALNARIGMAYMPAVKTDFPGVIKGKKTVTSIRSAVNDELARAKIAASESADLIQANLHSLNILASGYSHLFADKSQLVLKQCDDFDALVKTRIAEYEKSESDRREKDREQIRAEESEKAKAAIAAQEAPAPAQHLHKAVTPSNSGISPNFVKWWALTGKKLAASLKDDMKLALAAYEEGQKQSITSMSECGL